MNKKGIEKQRNCVFPFTYEGKTYNKCTKENSENGKSWCAFKVNRAGVVVNGKWADCNEGCPGLGKFGSKHLMRKVRTSTRHLLDEKRAIYDPWYTHKYFFQE